MDKLEKYRQIILDFLSKHSSYQSPNDPVEVEVVFDLERDHYQLVHVGWINDHRIYGCIIHIDIKNDKVWIQHDGTELGVGDELAELGIPKKDIVLGYHSPFKRQFTEFALG